MSDLVTIATYTNTTEATLAKDDLIASGIKAVLVGEEGKCFVARAIRNEHDQITGGRGRRCAPRRSSNRRPNLPARKMNWLPRPKTPSREEEDD